ncbi:MAG: amidohydrolase [Bryobacteraceae bacterium]|jgi:hippurate hydrolase
MKLFALLLLPALALASASPGDDLRPLADQELPSLVAIYQDLHAHPELSHHEERTSTLLAGELRKAGYTVTEHLGKYADGTQAFGIAAVLKNGAGPVLLVRTELDALPVEEKTGLPFASRVRSRNAAGQEVGVMHACGHDLHMTSLLGTARTLAKLKERWSGTLVLIGQPSEETVDGARAMLNDGFYSRFPKPDFAIALHDEPTIEAGKVGVLGGPIYAGSTAVEVTMRGMGGHGAHPELTKDPVVMAAEFIMELQTIVSRQMLPLDPAVVTVGSIHGGTKGNIIPDDVVLQLTTRAFSEDVREHILSSIKRMAQGVALAAGVPDDRAPIVKVSDTEAVPPTYNDPKLAARLRGVFEAALGAANVGESKPMMVSEDFGLFGLAGHQIPTVIFQLGAVSAQQIEESRRTGNPLPSLHSSVFYPQVEPAMRAGIVATTSAALELLKKP